LTFGDIIDQLAIRHYLGMFPIKYQQAIVTAFLKNFPPPLQQTSELC